jgi:hypothetical protein
MHLQEVQKGHITTDCFESHRMLGKGGFGTVLAVTRKFGTKKEMDELLAMKRLEKKRICEYP